jgi:hypothetical protein
MVDLAYSATRTFVVRYEPPAHAGSSLADFYALNMEAIRSSETAVHTRSTRRHVPEYGIFHSHRRENLKSYVVFRYGEATHRHIRQSAANCSRWFLARGFFCPEYGGDTFLRNVGLHKIYTA